MRKKTTKKPKAMTKSSQQKKVDQKSQASNDNDYMAQIQKPQQSQNPALGNIPQNLSKEDQEKLKKLHAKIGKFKDKLLEKFESYISGISILPPPKEVDEENKDKINLLILIDDSDSQKMTKEELKSKLSAIVDNIAAEIDPQILPQVMILSELWTACYDSKYEVLQLIAMSGIVYETGMLSAIKIAEVHKSMVLKKFEKYIVSYVLAGSLVQGRATPESDIDVWLVVDDTDVKKMSRAELKDKLRAIIIGMGIEAGEMTGIKNKLNIQIWILTDFWDGLKEANPVFFTMLRDGVPFYDRGIFMPWKNLLKMGRIKPRDEAIDLFMSSGDQVLQRVEFKLREIGMEDTFWAILTPSQAALMMYGIPPPTPKETPEVMRDIFVKKEKLLEEKYVKILEDNINVRKEMEHGSKKKLSGAEIDKLLHNSQEFLDRIKKWFDEIRKSKEKESILHIYDTAKTIVRDVLKLEGIKSVLDKDMLTKFDEEMIHKGKIPANFKRSLKGIFKAKADYDAGKLSKAEIVKVRKESSQFIKGMVEYMQRKRGRELERTKIRVKYGEKYGEVLLLDDVAFITQDIDAEQKEISTAKITAEGKLTDFKKSSLEELEDHLAKTEIPNKVFIKQPIFDDLKLIFGKNVEILVNY